MRDEDMLKYACRNIQQIFNGSPINVNSYFHVERDKKTHKVDDAYIDVKLTFQIDQYSLPDLENAMVKIKDQIMILENGRADNDRF